MIALLLTVILGAPMPPVFEYQLVPVVESPIYTRVLCGGVPETKWTTKGHDGWTTMQWCPDVADVLLTYDDWRPYDLAALMNIMGCESAGDPYWNEENWGTRPMSVNGLYSHRLMFWSDRSMRWLGRPGVMYSEGQEDDIAVAVGLYMDETPWHWDGCWPVVRRAL